MSDDFWRHPSLREAFASRNMGEVIRQYRRHPFHGPRSLSQERVAGWMGITQAQLSRIECRPPIVNLERLIDWARTLDIPGEFLWFELPREEQDVESIESVSPAGSQWTSDRRRKVPYYGAPAGEFLDGVSDLVEADAYRRQVLASLPFVIPALHEPTRNWLLSTLTSKPSGGPRMDSAQLQRIRQMLDMFAEMDAQQGGGHGRQALARYMRTNVLPLLRTETDEAMRRALFDLAGEQSQLLGWMSFDTGEYGLAQRYLLQALRFSEEAGNPILGAHTLATLSHLATTLGNAGEGVQLAKTGQLALRGRSQAMFADLAVMESRSHALLRDARSSAAAVHRAEKALSDVITDNEPPEMRFIDHAYIAGEVANTLVILGDSPRAVDFAEQSITSSLHQGRARRGALSNAVLAQARLTQRDVDGACAAGTEALRLSRDVDSTRTTQALQRLRRRFERYSASKPISTLIESIDAATV